ncbi:MAG TPA: hypothetical protein VF450_17460 [Noviherbaspirillum sp.]
MAKASKSDRDKAYARLFVSIGLVILPCGVGTMAVLPSGLVSAFFTGMFWAGWVGYGCMTVFGGWPLPTKMKHAIRVAILALFWPILKKN